MLLETIKNIDDLLKHAQVQDSNLLTKAPKLTKELGQIQWNDSARDIYNKVRGLKPWPMAYTFYQNKMLKILECELVESTEDNLNSVKNGEIVNIDSTGFTVSCGNEELINIKMVHFQNSKPMDARSFINGQRIEVGIDFNDV